MNIETKALREPETTEELMEMTQFVETARTTGMIALNARIKVR